MKMDKKKATPQKPIEIHAPQPPSTLIPENPNVLVYNFLKANNLRIKLEAVEPDGGFIGDGFLLEKKPLLKVVFERI
jgi:hypothetical protein